MTDSKPALQLRSRRIPHIQRVVITPVDGSESQHETIFDLSLGGMFVSTFLPLEVGQVFRFETPMDQMRFHGVARVLWIRGTDEGHDKPAGMAAEFLNLSGPQKRIIHRQITNLTGLGGELRRGTPPQPGRSPRSSASRTGREVRRSEPGLWSRLISSFLNWRP